MLFAFHYVCGFLFSSIISFLNWVFLFGSGSFVWVWFFHFVVSGLLEWKGSKIVLQRWRWRWRNVIGVERKNYVAENSKGDGGFDG